MKYPKLRELKEAVRALIRGPYTSKFPFAPHKPYPSFKGKPEFHQDDCMGCGACFQVCPAKAIELKDIKGKRVLTVNWDRCIFCGQCQANCPTEKGIKLSQEFDLSTTDRKQGLSQEIEKKLVFCDCCGEIIAPFDQILWVAKRLGPLVFSNASLMLFYMRGINLSLREEPAKEEDALKRGDRIKINCPRCRREAVLQS